MRKSRWELLEEVLGECHLKLNFIHVVRVEHCKCHGNEDVMSFMKQVLHETLFPCLCVAQEKNFWSFISSKINFQTRSVYSNVQLSAQIMNNTHNIEVSMTFIY